MENWWVCKGASRGFMPIRMECFIALWEAITWDKATRTCRFLLRRKQKWFLCRHFTWTRQKFQITNTVSSFTGCAIPLRVNCSEHRMKKNGGTRMTNMETSAKTVVII